MEGYHTPVLLVAEKIRFPFAIQGSELVRMPSVHKFSESNFPYFHAPGCKDLLKVNIGARVLGRLIVLKNEIETDILFVLPHADDRICVRKLLRPLRIK